MRIRRASLGSLFVLAVAGASACGGGPETLDGLIARHVEARGGRERLESIETLRASGRAMAGPGRQALVTREIRAPGHIRTEFTSQGVTAVYACDGSQCWYVDPLSGVFEAKLMPAAEASLAMEQADIVGPLVDWQAKGHSVELLGTETIDGRQAYKLEVTLSGGGVQIDYLDTESALLVRRESTRTLRGQTLEVETTFGDFRAVDGVLFPHSVRSGAKGRPDVLEIVVEEAALDVSVDDARFEIPR